ncbi:FecR domain-containing protein [Rhodopirellula sallentina]|uniref:FecR protein domain protein n=1 Tax=Rhodopirellula sallentina SM41 TaxID=1263870 RepID=M5UBK9_9BACT|nr:FecR domain-containing protein [Rhodopirellula sallentina]EMI53393.1 FecR protein domain protein [Rhodopirellula sallentina SM41]
MKNERLLEWIDELASDDISAEDHADLQKVLKADPAARSVFRERMDMEAGLRTWAAESDLPNDSEPSSRKSLRPASESTFRGMIRGPYLIAFAAAAGILLFIGIQVDVIEVGMPLRVAREEVARAENAGNKVVSDPVRSDLANPFVGVVRQRDDCQWAIRPVSANGQFALGRVSLQKGVAELAFDSGTDITLQAPCEIEVTSRDTARLIAGNVFVNVTELSNGFVLRTPESRILDEGTEYGVSVGEQATEVHVFDGRVVWIPDDAGNASQADVEERIDAGQAKSYLRSQPTRSKFIPFGKRQFVRRVEQQIKQSAGDALLAYDGFENLAGRVRRGRSGFGWSDGWQAGNSLAGGRGRGQLADIVDAPADVVFGIDRDGHRLMSIQNGSDLRRAFDQPLAVGSGERLFIAVLVQQSSASQDDQGRSLVISLEPDLPGRGRRLHQIASFGITTEGFPFINSGNSIAKTATRIVPGQTYLCVLRLAAENQTDETVMQPTLRLYQPGEDVDSVEPSLWTVTGEPRRASYPTSSLRIIAGDQASWQIDELKVGTTWQSVTKGSIK